MSKKLTANVHVAGRYFEAGTTPPKEFADQITNPAAWAAADSSDGPPAKAGKGSSVDADSSDGPPPKAGRGSSVDAWKAYADANGVGYDDGASREDVIAALEAAGVLTE